MRYKKFKNTYIVRVEKGEEAIEELTKLCRYVMEQCADGTHLNSPTKKRIII